MTRAKPHPIGKWFHSWKWDDGKPEMHWQGQVLKMSEPGKYVVQLYDWFMGAPSTKEVVTTRDMIAWSFYESDIAMRRERDRHAYRDHYGVEPPSREPRRRPSPAHKLRCNTCGCYYKTLKESRMGFGRQDGDLCLDQSSRQSRGTGDLDPPPCPGVITWNVPSDRVRPLDVAIRARPMPEIIDPEEIVLDPESVIGVEP